MKLFNAFLQKSQIHSFIKIKLELEAILEQFQNMQVQQYKFSFKVLRIQTIFPGFKGNKAYLCIYNIISLASEWVNFWLFLKTFGFFETPYLGSN